MKAHKREEFATLACPLASPRELNDPNAVKVVPSDDGYALWFSRLPVPYVRKRGRQPGFGYRHHIGVYFYRRAALRAFGSWPQSSVERAESLEQLRILEHGGRIRLFETRARLMTVDAPSDVRRLSAIVK
jgi:3-deoxy-manno-octulosonate cytidylyltransferase (CMP-KDO synthetase)